MPSSISAAQGRGRLRPRYELRSPIPPRVLNAALRAGLRHPDCPVDGELLDDHLRLAPPSAERRAWTPVLEARLVAQDTGTRLLCQFGPDPGAWTLFMAIYLGSVFAAFTGLIFAWSQHVVGQPPTALWALAAAGGAVGLLHFVAWRGQRATAPQMEQLAECLLELLRAADGGTGPRDGGPESGDGGA
jgi:hypothetical protein